MGEGAVCLRLQQDLGSRVHFPVQRPDVLNGFLLLEFLPLPRSHPRLWFKLSGNRLLTGLEMKREGSMHLVPAPAVRLMKSRVTSRPGNKVFSIVISLLAWVHLSSAVSICHSS